MIRIALDASGGDHAPQHPVSGALEAHESLCDTCEIILVGQQEAVNAELEKQGGAKLGIRVVDAPEIIGMDEKPLAAIKSKRKSSIALGMALSTDGRVVSLDGDGSLLMNMGTIATIGREKPKNLIVVVWDNEQWAQTGNQPSHTAYGTDLEQVAKSCGIAKTATVSDEEELQSVFMQAMEEDGPWFIVAKVEEMEEYMPVGPIEPEMTTYRMRRSFT